MDDDTPQSERREALALYAQFGAGFKRLRAFRAQFIESIELALAVYPDARISIDEAGVILRPSRPAIAKQ